MCPEPLSSVTDKWRKTHYSQMGRSSRWSWNAFELSVGRSGMASVPVANLEMCSTCGTCAVPNQSAATANQSHLGKAWPTAVASLENLIHSEVSAGSALSQPSFPTCPSCWPIPSAFQVARGDGDAHTCPLPLLNKALHKALMGRLWCLLAFLFGFKKEVFRGFWAIYV